MRLLIATIALVLFPFISVGTASAAQVSTEAAPNPRVIIEGGGGTKPVCSRIKKKSHSVLWGRSMAMSTTHYQWCKYPNSRRRHWVRLLLVENTAIHSGPCVLSDGYDFRTHYYDLLGHSRAFSSHNRCGKYVNKAYSLRTYPRMYYTGDDAPRFVSHFHQRWDILPDHQATRVSHLTRMG